jgi:hypothetical protein
VSAPAPDSPLWRPAETLPDDGPSPVYLRIRSASGALLTEPARRHSVYADRWVWQDSCVAVDGEITGWAPVEAPVNPPGPGGGGGPTVSCPGAEMAACPVCGAADCGDAQERCKGGASCPAERLWDEACRDCGDVICTCTCAFCGGDGLQEDEDDLCGGAYEPCSACRGSGLARKQVIW